MPDPMEPVSERPPCPRCGSTRLVGRRRWVRRPSLGSGMPFWQWCRYWMRRPTKRGALLCYTYHCEICSHQWRVFGAEQPPEQSPRAR